jgi:hypothetical protein
MACTACLVCLFSTVIGLSQKSQKCLGRCGASSRHITKLEQSIFFRYLWLVQQRELFLYYCVKIPRSQGKYKLCQNPFDVPTLHCQSAMVEITTAEGLWYVSICLTSLVITTMCRKTIIQSKYNS